MNCNQQLPQLHILGDICSGNSVPINELYTVDPAQYSATTSCLDSRGIDGL